MEQWKQMVFVRHPKHSMIQEHEKLTVGEKYLVKDDVDFPETHYNVSVRPDHLAYPKCCFGPPPRVSAIPELLKAPVEERLDAHPVKILTDG